MVGTPCWAASTTAETQPSLREGQHVHRSPLQHMVFGHVVDVTVEGHRRTDTEPLHVLDEPPSPPAVADDVEMQTGVRGSSRATASARPRSVCGTSRDSTTTRGAAARGPNNDCAGANLGRRAPPRSAHR